ncbi:MAG: hypothetical protein HY270_15295 [Deltaproteobacteria bacterium]|nr:hypothetical protein [Deltaproteobacteria bacterium]
MRERAMWKVLIRVVQASLVCLLGLSLGIIALDQWSADRVAVIPPGQEDLLAAMLGRDGGLPPSCFWKGAHAERGRVVSTYECGGSRLEIELRHPSQGTSTAVRTSRFAIVVSRGVEPADLIAALASNVRSREAAFGWEWSGLPPRPWWKRHARGLILSAGWGLLALALRRESFRLAVATVQGLRWCLTLVARGLRYAVQTAATRLTELYRRLRAWRRNLGREERWILVILLASAVARAWLCVINTEANDDHLQVVALIRNAGWVQPASSVCM